MACEKGPDGEVVAKKRIPSTATANLPSLSARVTSKIFCSTYKWQNHKHKLHCTTAVACALSILNKEAFGKSFVDRANYFALEVAAAVLTPLCDSLESASGIGNSEFEVSCLGGSLERLGRPMPRGHAVKGLRAHVKQPVESLSSFLHQYCIESLGRSSAAFASEEGRSAAEEAIAHADGASQIAPSAAAWLGLTVYRCTCVV